MFYIKAISAMFKNHFSVFLGLFLGFGFMFLHFMYNFVPDFYMDSLRYILVSIRDLFFESESFYDSLLKSLFFLSLFFMMPVIIIALIISIVSIKLDLDYKKISLSVMAAPIMLFIIALFSKIKEGPTHPIPNTGVSYDGTQYGITSYPMSINFWEEYIELIQAQFVCASMFIFFFIIFFKFIKKNKFLKEF